MKITQFIPPLLLCLLVFGFAQDEGLYPDPPPPDAAFVRVINGLGSAVTPTLGERNFPEVAPLAASDYYIVLQGEADFSGTELEETFSIAAGKFYTLALLPGADAPSVTLLEDTPNTNRAKSVLSLYNLSDLAALDLKTADGETPVLTDVAPMTTAALQVNPITVDLAVFAGEEAIGAESLVLERGAVYSAVVLGTADAPTILWELTETVLED